MQFSALPFSTLAFAVSAFALPSLLPSSSSDQPGPFYPIGTSNGTNAKVSGRLFAIDGKVEYFAGLFNLEPRCQLLIHSREQCLVAGTFEQQFRC
jgi:hypothetical protein